MRAWLRLCTSFFKAANGVLADGEPPGGELLGDFAGCAACPLDPRHGIARRAVLYQFFDSGDDFGRFALFPRLMSRGLIEARGVELSIPPKFEVSYCRVAARTTTPRLLGSVMLLTILELLRAKE